MYDNLKNYSDVTSATSFSTAESISLQSSNLLELFPTTSKSLAQIAAEKIKEGRYSYRVEKCNQSKSSKSTATTKSSSTTSSSSSSQSSAPSSYAKLPSTVLKYMFKCNGGKVGETIVPNEDTHGVVTTKSKDTTTSHEPSDADSISSRTTISTLSSRSRRSKTFQARRNQILDASGHKSAIAATTVVTSSVAPSSKEQHMEMMTMMKKKKEPITIVASSLGRGGGYMIPIDEMNDACPFDEDNGVELQLVEDHDYYLSKISNEITEHQRRVERELRKSRRALHHRSDIRSSQSSSGTSRSVEMTRTPSEADF